VQSNGAGNNGAGAREPAPRKAEPAPRAVQDLADACVRFVERALALRLDYEPETLSILDHYLDQGRITAGERREAAVLVAHAAGAYFGEVVRRRYPSWWRLDGDDPAAWRLEFESVYLSFSPIQLVADALFRAEGVPDPAADDEAGTALETAGDDMGERFELEEGDQRAVAERLAELPPVPLGEFYAPSTRLEVIDIIVDAIRGKRMAEGNEADADLGPEDYES
jgi:hypothetical protein